MPERNDHITEIEARRRIHEALHQLRIDRSLGAETKTSDDNASVDYHVDNILKASGGVWNQTIAKDYIENLRTQIGQELEAPQAS